MIFISPEQRDDGSRTLGYTATVRKYHQQSYGDIILLIIVQAFVANNFCASETKHRARSSGATVGRQID